MALVVDAVNHLFHPPNQHSADSAYLSSSPAHSPTPHSDRLQAQPALRTPMSASSHRAGSSQTSTRTTPSQPARRHVDGQSTDYASASSRDEQQQPPSPSLAAQSVPSEAAADTRNDPQPPRQNGQHSSSPSETSPDNTDASGTATPQRLKIRDLAHIQSIAREDARSYSGEGYNPRYRDSSAPQYEISAMPIENIIEMVAGLLTKITTTNDMQHEHLHRQMSPSESAANLSSQTSSVLAFHGKNVPSITILSYLNRINKYCPTSYEVFLSLLVYFDRMTEKVNAGPMQSLREATQHAQDQPSSPLETPHQRPTSSAQTEGVSTSTPSQTATPPLSGEFEKPSPRGPTPGTPHSRPHQPESPGPMQLDADALNLSHFFVVDSFNIHRLVIAGVTCASKFFSDIFYTNSRYAKVRD